MRKLVLILIAVFAVVFFYQAFAAPEGGTVSATVEFAETKDR